MLSLSHRYPVFMELGSPDDYMNMMVSLRPGMEIDRDDVIKGLIDMQYDA